MRRLITALALVALCCFAATALAATRSVTAVESGGLAYSKSKIKVKSGKVTLKMVNPSSLALDHSISIKGNGVSKKGNVVEPGGTSTVTATLAPGKYTFYCHVEEHEEDGMKGKLKVKSG